MALVQSRQSILVAPAHIGTKLSSATAFIVIGRHGFVLVTSRHVVTGKDNRTGSCLHRHAAVPNELIVSHRVDDIANQPARFDERSEALYSVDGSPRWIEHPTLGAPFDCVAIELEHDQRIAVVPYQPGASLDAQLAGELIRYAPADPVSVVGFPFGLHTNGFPIWATGFIASEPSENFEKLPAFLIDCRGRSGQSGSPVAYNETAARCSSKTGA